MYNIDKTEEANSRIGLFQRADETWGAKEWSLTVTNQIIDFIEREGNQYSVGVVTFIKIEIKHSSIVREDLGYASLQGPNKGSILCQARKESYTNALAAVLESFDNNTIEPMKLISSTEEKYTPNKIPALIENKSAPDNASTSAHVASRNVIFSSTPIERPSRPTLVAHTDDGISGTIHKNSVVTKVAENTLSRKIHDKKVMSEEELRAERKRIQREKQEEFRQKFLKEQNQKAGNQKENGADWESMDDVIISTQDVERAVSEAH